jgi:hypothetical protein
VRSAPKSASAELFRPRLLLIVLSGTADRVGCGDRLARGAVAPGQQSPANPIPLVGLCDRTNDSAKGISCCVTVADEAIVPQPRI